MGASQSQDIDRSLQNNSIKPQNQERNVQPMEKTADSELVDAKSRAMEKIQLPHNYEFILKDADSPVDISSIDKLFSQLHAGVFLNQKRKKYWVDKKSNKNCFMLFARNLSITWAEDYRYWHWSHQKETTTSDVFIDVAELLQVCWLEVHGKFDVANLSPGTFYEVVLIVMLRDQAFGWEISVNFRLTLPNGQKVERKVELMTKPRGKWIEIPVGEFTTSSQNIGELEIYIHEYDAGIRKGGLIVKGVAIQPKN
ncbi:protein PHLOEM PROTEIN 2-LIKE A1-like [Durio zibethinus]|uniref:Protein PHLOEM PROTEIN 2-LIKE A1-like n=1 Tax=Durio zibethinus TaxID=66656 RepID=A0A6P5WJ57_DURZI|nr:protein PHLOEM PROTEIN 2-LIKE A1-like [Durio zibethinus]